MLDLARTWPPPPDWQHARLEGTGVAIRSIHGSDQHMIGGDLRAWSIMSGLSGEGHGAFAVTKTDPCCLRVSRDQLLVVGQLPPVAGGWRDGYVVSDMSAALHVFEVSGRAAHAITARATALDPLSNSPSAKLLFAGVEAVVYRHPGPDNWRIHVDRALATYLWSWFSYSSQEVGGRY